MIPTTVKEGMGKWRPQQGNRDRDILWCQNDTKRLEGEPEIELGLPRLVKRHGCREVNRDKNTDENGHRSGQKEDRLARRAALGTGHLLGFTHRFSP